MKKEEIIQKITEHSVLIKEINEDVKDIKHNHLPHLHRKMDNLFWRILGIILGSITIPIWFLLFKLLWR